MKYLGVGKHLQMDAGFGQSGAQILLMQCKEVAQVNQALIRQGPPRGPGSSSISFIQICILQVS